MEIRLMTRSWTFYFRGSVLPIIVIILILPVIYLSGLRFVAELIVPTDTSSLWESPAHTSQKASDFTLATLARFDPFSPDYPYLLAVKLSAEDPGGAMRLNRKAIRRSVLSPRYQIQEGWLRAQNGDLSDAFLSFEKAIFLDPMNVNAHIQKGLFLFFQVMPNVEGEQKDIYRTMAEKSLSLAAQYDPSLLRSPLVSLALASIYSEIGDKDEARTVLRESDDMAVLDPGFLVKKWALHFELGDAQRPIAQWGALFRGDKLTEADFTTLTVEMAKQTIPDFRYFEAQILMQRGEMETARQKMSSCVSERPHVAEYRLALGDIYEKLGKRSDALTQYEKALKLSPANQYAKSKMIEYYKER